jgi:hypothetical protein
LLGGANTGVSLAVNPVAREKKIPFLHRSGGDSRANKDCRPYILYYAYDTTELGNGAATTIFDDDVVFAHCRPRLLHVIAGIWRLRRHPRADQQSGRLLFLDPDLSRDGRGCGHDRCRQGDGVTAQDQDRRHVRAWGMFRAKGLMEQAMYVMQVKKPSETKYPWDYHRIVQKISGEQAFGKLADSTCPLVEK